MIGMSDLARGHCSEEATVRGILKVAQTLQRRFPQSVVVIQGLLPQTWRADGLLEPMPIHTHLFGKRQSEKYKAEMAVRAFGLWPSIQSINKELAKFCRTRENFVYFDPSLLFLQKHYDPKHGITYKIIKKLMPDFFHLSVYGWRVLGEAILEGYMRIVWDEDHENQIERKDDSN